MHLIRRRNEFNEVYHCDLDGYGCGEVKECSRYKLDEVLDRILGGEADLKRGRGRPRKEG